MVILNSTRGVSAGRSHANFSGLGFALTGDWLQYGTHVGLPGVSSDLRWQQVDAERSVLIVKSVHCGGQLWSAGDVHSQKTNPYQYRYRYPTPPHFACERPNSTLERIPASRIWWRILNGWVTGVEITGVVWAERR